ncbi:hypothetical protein BC628DRAFT_1377477 [Trametes gibbosa]|nr:hypothetical protein BC628DRAFT_1377477 [Trametes gibbosa]
MTGHAYWACPTCVHLSSVELIHALTNPDDHVGYVTCENSCMHVVVSSWPVVRIDNCSRYILGSYVRLHPLIASAGIHIVASVDHPHIRVICGRRFGTQKLLEPGAPTVNTIAGVQDCGDHLVVGVQGTPNCRLNESETVGSTGRLSQLRPGW